MPVKSIRDAYGEALCQLGERDSRIVVLDADVGSSAKSALFGAKFPQRYFNVGISEMNLLTMAAGFATEGLIPFANTFAVFMATRAADPVQSLVAYDKLNVKLAGAYSGLSDAYDGASHHSITDIAFMRSLPNMTVLSVCDAVETRKAVFACVARQGPVYLRLSRAEMPVIFDDGYAFEIGKGVMLQEGNDVSIVATGAMVHIALAAANALKQKGITAEVIDMHTIQPLDEALLEQTARKTGAVVVAEEHSQHGGLGSAVVECLARRYPVPVEQVGMTTFAQSGEYSALLAKYGLDASAIEKASERVTARK